ncbi:3'-5' exoribonuclease [Burkholderia stagnalis]|uniref:3'-5' exoribonuclease n=1 Tax=Burkholderia stagnalis TaxID=1503054 RepID=UPI0009BCE5EB|nr:3'-5' exoribonuclease [Burkholderia stagnalis]
MPLHVFVDTEFTDFIECDLISIGLVAEDGREFYGERSDFDQASCSEFVRAAVLPQLGRYPDRVFTRDGLCGALRAWLSQFSNGSEPRHLCFDYGGDWELLCDLLDGPPSGWLATNVAGNINHERAEYYYRTHGGRHHALADARATRFAMMS